MPTLCFDLPDGLFAVDGFAFAAPVYSLDGADVSDFAFASEDAPRPLHSGGTERVARYISRAMPDVTLALALRTFPDSPVVRWRFTLASDGTRRLTKPDGSDRLAYLAARLPGSVTELRLSEFDTVEHTFRPTLVPVDAAERAIGLTLPGPVLLCERGGDARLLAYEHGAEYPDSYLAFDLTADAVTLRAVKGNYWSGKPLAAETSVWFEYARTADRDALSRAYRRFLLEFICDDPASREPLLFYNTWNAQERAHDLHGRPYLESLTLDHTLAEIDRAYRLGVEVFVIDTGWYDKTGDWSVDPDRFPDSLAEVKARLDGYGMRLGLWFNPIVAARTTSVCRDHPEWVVSRDGVPNDWGRIWETEESFGMCLCTGYADWFADRLIALNQTLGVTYFKWDAIGQYGCNDVRHGHGSTPQEAADCYSYGLGLAMLRVVEKLTAACPGVIVDFDITEAARFVGLGFLAVGKYFLINNGPYFSSFDTPASVQITPPYSNVCFWPGAARARVCRKSILFDDWIPSILFLTHFFPDPPRLSQDNALASLVLGGNGFWGDLFALSDDDFAYISGQIAAYRRVRGSVTRAYPRFRGRLGGSPEIIEKLYEGCGIVVLFTKNRAAVRHITAPLPPNRRVTGADSVDVAPDGSLILRVDLPSNGARIVFIEDGE